MPRRSSYASVVSGAASTPGYQHPMRSGAFSHLLNHPNDLAYEASYRQQTTPHSRHDPRGLDTDMLRNGGSYGAAGSWSRSGQLPSFSSGFAPLFDGLGPDEYNSFPAGYFFVPTYLRNSKYVQRLRDAHNEKLATHNDAADPKIPSQPGSLSTQNSSTNLHPKLAPSHRGMTYDLIEKAPPAEAESISPLPSMWNSEDKYGGVEVQADGLEVKFTGTRPSSEREHEASSIRADFPMPVQCGIYYYEVKILSRKREEYEVFILGRDVVI